MNEGSPEAKKLLDAMRLMMGGIHDQINANREDADKKIDAILLLAAEAEKKATAMSPDSTLADIRKQIASLSQNIAASTAQTGVGLQYIFDLLEANYFLSTSLAWSEYQPHLREMTRVSATYIGDSLAEWPSVMTEVNSHEEGRKQLERLRANNSKFQAEFKKVWSTRIPSKKPDK